MSYRIYDHRASTDARTVGFAAIAAVTMTAVTLAFSVVLPARTDSNLSPDRTVMSSAQAAHTADARFVPTRLDIVRERIEVTGVRSSELASAGADKSTQCTRAMC